MIVRETLINYYFVVPAQAGIQKYQIVIDSRPCFRRARPRGSGGAGPRGNDVDQIILKSAGYRRLGQGFICVHLRNLRMIPGRLGKASI